MKHMETWQELLMPDKTGDMLAAKGTLKNHVIQNANRYAKESDHLAQAPVS